MAQHEHLHLNTPFDKPIDVFGIIETTGVWLMFQPMNRLFGAYERISTTAGILINSSHPVSLQRSTAAHEYGHHVLGHASHFDGEEQIDASGRTEQEAAAQAFAADFLMPLQLVNYTLRSLGFPIEKPSLTALDVYRLSLELGASYAATVNQLVALKKISYGYAFSLRKKRPIAIKEELTGLRPQHPRADVWLLDISQLGRKITPRLQDEVHVVLDETPSTGYLWVQNEKDGVELLQESFEAPDFAQNEIIGGTGKRHFVFRVTEPGDHTLRLIMTRPWQRDKPASMFEAQLIAKPRVTGSSDRGLPETQKELLLATVD